MPVTIVAHDVGDVGGMERQLAELIVGLRGRGHAVTVVARSCVLPADAGVDFHRVRAPRRPFPIFYVWFMLFGSLTVRRRRRGVVQTTGAIALNRVDVVAVHCCHAAYTPVALRPTRLFRWYGAGLGALKRLGERLCVARNPTATFVCVSEGVAEEVRNHFPGAADRAVAIPNGVDVSHFAPGAGRERARALRAEAGISSQALVAAFVGGFWEHKGLALAIEALADAPGWELVVAGPGERERYERLADTLGVAARLHWLGVVREIQPVYEMADAFVLPSSYETFSLVTYEAAACGLAIVATPVNGVRELVVDGVGGILVERSAEAVAAALRRLADEPRLRESLGRAARRAAASFGWDEMVRRHEELYERIAARGGA